MPDLSALVRLEGGGKLQPQVGGGLVLPLGLRDTLAEGLDVGGEEDHHCACSTHSSRIRSQRFLSAITTVVTASKIG